MNTLATQEDEASLIARQLLEQYDKAVNGLVEQVKFGAMLLSLDSRVSALTRPGPDSKGQGLKGFLADRCPQINRSTAYLFRDYAKAAQAVCKLGAEASLADLLTAPPEALPDQVARLKQQELFGLLRGTSGRGLLTAMREITTGEPGLRGGRRERKMPPLPTDPEKERELFLAACREDFTACFLRLDALLMNGHWKAPSITDAEVEMAAAAAEKFQRLAGKWLKTPRAQRDPLQLEDGE